METVKIDIQKLQLLNDRIAQTIDALNQVRLSAHGIQHAQQPFGAWSPYSAMQQVPQYVPYAQSYGQQYTGSPYVGSPYVGSQFQMPFTSPFGGLQHTTQQFAQQIPTWTMPFIGTGQTFTQPYTQPFTQAFTQPWGGTQPWVGNGLSHTTWDPTWQMRA